MGYITTNSGGRLDIGKDIAKNINSAAMFDFADSESTDMGRNTEVPSFQVLYANPNGFRNASNTYTGAYGGWYKVPDSSIEVRQRLIIETPEIVWKLPNGSAIPLIPETEVKGVAPMFRWGYVYGLSNVYVKLNAKTIPGFRAFGLLDGISPDTVRDILNTPKEVIPPSTGETVQSSLRSLVVIAILGTAIWFLPKNILRS